jgi:HEAT repeat protein
VRRVLAALVDVEGEDIRAHMREQLESTDLESVNTALRYFESHHDRDAHDAIEAMARNVTRRGDDELVVAALASSGDSEARETLSDLASHTGRAQGAALSALANLPGGEDEALAIATRILSSDRGDAVSQALEVVSRAGGPDALSLLEHEATSDPPSGRAVALLVERGDAASMRVVERVATEPTPWNRMLAIQEIGSFGGTNADAIVTRALHDENPGVRQTALAALIDRGPASASSALEEALGDHESNNVTVALTHATRAGMTVGLDRLARLAHDSDGLIAHSALEAIVAQNPSRADDVITSALADNDAARRLVAVELAARLAPDDALRIYTTAIRDHDTQVAEQAAEALAALGGSDAQRLLVDAMNGAWASDEMRSNAAWQISQMGGPIAEQYHARIVALTDSEAGVGDVVSFGDSQGAIR